MIRRLALRFRRDERGAVMVIAAGAMLAMLAMAAFAIDVGSWYQVQRQAQGAADAAALAAAQDLPGSPANAISDGQTYGNTDMACTNCTTIVNLNSTQVKATITTTARSFFGGLLNVTSANVSASAVANETPGQSTCSTPGNDCYAIYATDSNCGTANSPNYGVTFNGSGDTITGGVHSSGGIDLIGGSQHLGPTTYGNGENCKLTQGTSNNSFTSATAEAPPSYLPSGWPLDYSTILTACGGTGQVSCSGPGGTPSYCTVASTSNITIGSGSANGVYCAVGSGLANDPSTYTGFIDLRDTSTSPVISATMLAGAVQCAVKNCAAQPYLASYPLIYAADTDAQASAVAGVSYPYTGTGQNETFTGAIFAPKGTIEFNGAGGTSNFLESKDVILVGGSFFGNGPPDSGSGSSTSGSSSLIQ